MKYAFIADIHANIEALTAVLAAIDSLGADRILCLGDVVGRFADPDACVDLLRERRIATVGGNHDRAAAGQRDTSWFSAKARRSNEWTQSHIKPRTLRFLQDLPLLKKVDDRLIMVHAALHPEPNDETYLTTSEQISRSLKALQTNRYGVSLAFFGHTHIPGVHRLYQRGILSGRMTSAADSYNKLFLDSVYLVNPGSVGQPRDGDPRASFAIYDSQARSLRFHRAAFDSEAALAKARRAGLIGAGADLLE